MIDWARVQELQSEVGADDFREVVDLFLEEADEVIERLTASASKPNAADFHFLKGSALNLGFAEFAKICADGERNAENGAAAAPDVQAAATSYQASRAQLLKKLETLPTS